MSVDRLSYVRGRCSRFDQPPRMVPAGNVDVSGNGRWRIWEFAGTKIDAPILGNGDLLAAFAGPPEYPQFWLTTNDFWQMESNPNYEFFHDNAVAKRDPAVGMGSPRPLGRLVLDIPQLRGARYEAWQSFETATTTARFTNADGKCLQLDAWVAATENELVVELMSDVACDVSLEFYFPNELGKGCDVGVDCMGDCEDDEPLSGTFKGLIGGRPLQVRHQKGGVLWGYRAYEDNVDVPTKCAFGARFLNEDGLSLHVTPGEKRTLVVAVRSWAKTARPVEYARSRARWISEGDIAALRALHEHWWREYWRVSGVELEDELLMTAYCTAHYMMGSLSRDAHYPPNILGICTYDRMAWNGNYKINYNHQTPYLGLLAAGRFEQADPHDAPYLDMLDIGREMCRRLLGHEGVYLPLGLGPRGMVSEALLLHMKSPAVHGALNMLMRWRLTMDRAYLLKVYPFLQSVARFWECDLVERDGALHVVGDGMHERITKNIVEDGVQEDPTNTLGYLRSFFRDMIAASEFLALDADKRPVWQDILSRLAPYRVGTIDDIQENPTLWNEGELTVGELLPDEMKRKKVFFNEGKGGSWSVRFPGNIMHIYPGGAIGLDSPKALLDTARNTVAALSEMEHAQKRHAAQRGDVWNGAGAWNATNLGCLFFVAAVRVGFDPETIIQELRDKLAAHGLPNGFLDNNPHGIEILSTVPNTLQEMMLLSHEGVLRFFRVWPRQTLKNARFFGLRAWGGFIVDAALREGELASARVESPAGGPLAFENPWDGPALVNGQVHTGRIIHVDTAPGGVYAIARG